MAASASRLSQAVQSLGGLALTAFAVGPLLAHFELVAPMVGFVLFALGILLAVLTIVAGIVAVVRGGGGAVLRGFLPALLVVVIAVIVARPGADVPRINDITTDTEHPPEFVHAPTLPGNEGRDMTYPGEEFARQQKEGYPDLTGLPLDVSPDQAFARVRLEARSTPGWVITREDMGKGTLEGYDTSWLFRFKDDFVIEVRPRDGGSAVHMRSKSRDGKGDIGANAKRIEAFFERLGSE
jgi:uncharacterized protein (DUF1499 family)